jgi:hypothetical protein
MSPLVIVLTVVSVVFLLLYFRGRNAVWGGATLGIIVGVIISLIKHNWTLLAWSFSIGTLSGVFFEWTRHPLKWMRWGKPKLGVIACCLKYYDTFFTEDHIAEISRDSHFKMFVTGEKSFKNIDKDTFFREITALRFEIFALVWSYKFNERLAVLQSIFTRQYLEKNQQLDIWEAMSFYNHIIATFAYPLPLSGRRISDKREKEITAFREKVYNRLYDSFVDESMQKKEVDNTSECIVRVMNRTLSDGIIDDKIRRIPLQMGLQQRLGCGLEITSEGDSRLEAEILFSAQNAVEAINKAH